MSFYSEDALTQPPLQVAARLVTTEFSGCLAAFLAGSVIREDHTSTSDLDIVIVTEKEPAAPYRHSLLRGGWPVELFVHTPESIKRFFEMDRKRRRPALPQMCAEGLIIWQEDDWADTLKTEAQTILRTGPEPLSADEILLKRYQISDLLDDLRGSQHPEESIFIAPQLADAALKFYLCQQGCWLGEGKWLHRVLKQQDPVLALQVIEALQALYCDQLSQPLISLVENILSPAGGPLFDGYYSEAPKS